MPDSTPSPPDHPKIVIAFDRGTLTLTGLDEASARALPGVMADPRIGGHRVDAIRYRELILALRRAERPYEDQARTYEVVDCRLAERREPFSHQSAAAKAFLEAGGRGVIVLPTGSGKTYVAQLAMEQIGRATLVVTPTIDLMQQWSGVLRAALHQEIGLVGGGSHDLRPITVTTYDSAYLHMEKFGGRFGLLVFDECHHLPGPSVMCAAEMSLAPYRLGLTATLEREDGRESMLQRLIGPTIFRKDIKELAGNILADYDTVRVSVRLSESEKERYLEARRVYREFVSKNGISFGSPSGWARFLAATSQSREGRRAFLAYREQRELSLAAAAKLDTLDELLQRHKDDRVLVFTQDNETVYKIARRWLVPAITHQTKVKERHEILSRFNDGEWPVLATSKVLNEGVDVPSANVAVILSGSGTVREHVQRLGRILRRGEGKRALLYEVVTTDTGEEFTSERRRQHDAYR